MKTGKRLINKRISGDTHDQVYEPFDDICIRLLDTFKSLSGSDIRSATFDTVYRDVREATRGMWDMELDEVFDKKSHETAKKIS